MPELPALLLVPVPALPVPEPLVVPELLPVPDAPALPVVPLPPVPLLLGLPVVDAEPVPAPDDVSGGSLPFSQQKPSPAQ